MTTEQCNLNNGKKWRGEKKGGKKWRDRGDGGDTRERADEMTIAEKNQNQTYSHLCLEVKGEKNKKA